MPVETVKDVLLSGSTVMVDLLTEVPTSNDPATWKFPIADNYRPQAGVPQLDIADDGVIGKLVTQWPINQAGVMQARAFGVTWQGECLMVGTVAFGALPPFGTVPLTINFVVQPWEEP